MSRNVQELEDEIGVDLLRRGPRGVSLTAEGLLKRADESVDSRLACYNTKRASLEFLAVDAKFHVALYPH